jgi:hypothetical protein
MKKIFLSLIVINSLQAKDLPKKVIVANKSEFLICLSALYTAEIAYYAENDFYSDEFESMGFNLESSCKKIDLRVYSPGGDHFIAYAKKNNTVWSIDNKKRIVNLKN